MTTQFTVKLDNKPGELGKLATTLGDRGINIIGIAGTTAGKKGILQFLTSDDAGTRKALKDAKFAFAEREVLIATLENRPGTLGQLGKNLGAARVNIESLVAVAPANWPAGLPATVAIGVDKPEKAKGIVK